MIVMNDCLFLYESFNLLSFAIFLYHFFLANFKYLPSLGNCYEESDHYFDLYSVILFSRNLKILRTNKNENKFYI